MVYGSAVLNVSILGFVWISRQMKMAEKEEQERQKMEASLGKLDDDRLLSSNKFRCFFAAQQYHMMLTETPTEANNPGFHKLLDVLAQCQQELYRGLPAETPAMRPLHMPSQPLGNRS